MRFANGYTMALTINMDPLGKTFISIAVLWTVVLSLGIAFLISKRNLPFLRIRNVPLAVSAVSTIQIYWVLCLLTYVLEGYFPCNLEYWIMSVYLPLGMALFQACNTQLLHVADLQRKYTDGSTGTQQEKGNKGKQGMRQYMAYSHAKNRMKTTLQCIAYGIIVQLTVTTIIFLISRKFHSFGIVGSKIFTDVTEDGSLECLAWMEDNGLIVSLSEKTIRARSCSTAKRIACRRGWEWIPSIIWQFFWSWFYAPYLLWKVHDVEDVHGWRNQTRLCCLSSLFASPMWLCALYIPDMLAINTYFVPPMWFVPSIFLIQVSLIFVPCWQVVKNRRLKSDVLDVINEWESKNHGSSVGGDTMVSSSKVSKKPSTTSTTSSRRGEMYTMQALESAIRTNPQPLLIFAATKDFSGENISFLTKVIGWRRGWSPSSPMRSGFLRCPSVNDITNPNLQRQQFNKAVDIFASHICLKYSDYPINLSYVHLKELQAIFGTAATIMYGCNDGDSDANSATPFESFNFSRFWSSKGEAHHEDIESSPRRKHDGVSLQSHKTQHTNASDRSTNPFLQTTDYGRSKRSTVFQSYEMPIMAAEQLPEYVPIPEGFGPDVFDRAEDHIKYMVLTNTWPKFISAGYASTASKQKAKKTLFTWSWRHASEEAA